MPHGIGARKQDSSGDRTKRHPRQSDPFRVCDASVGGRKPPYGGLTRNRRTPLLEVIFKGDRGFSEGLDERRDAERSVISNLDYQAVNEPLSTQGNKNDFSGRPTIKGLSEVLPHEIAPTSPIGAGRISDRPRLNEAAGESELPAMEFE
ncbi:MAG TPA: hypothetical protein VGX03_32545, partial [Candidatus Binatia bacterium]|nr:hypothetical protein [Candidatus Binatia bacterium]